MTSEPTRHGTTQQAPQARRARRAQEAPQNGHGHGHAHHHGGEDIDWAAMAGELERGAELTLSAVTQAARWLRDLSAGHGGPGVRRVLDVGSGPGVTACVLAGTFPRAEVVAVDGSAFLLERARARAARAGFGEDRFTTLEAGLPEGFGMLGQADLIWSSRAVHHLGDQQEALDRLAAALREGGLLAISEGGLPLRFLPRDIGLGRPGLAARIEAVREEWFTAMRADLPGSTAVVEDWPAMLRRAGLTPAGSRTFLTDLPAPLDDSAREYLHTHLGRIREVLDSGLAAEDLRTIDALLDDDSPHSIRRRPDAFCLMADTVHTAVRSGR